MQGKEQSIKATTEERTFREIKRLCYSGLGVDALGRGVAARLHRAVPFDSYCISPLDPSSGLPTGMMADKEAGDEKDVFFFLKHIYFDDDITDMTWLARRKVGAMTLSEATNGRLERALRHREYNVSKGFANELRCAFTQSNELWGGLCLVREKGASDFGEREVALMKRLSPHLASGFRGAALAGNSRSEASGSDTPGVLMLDGKGNAAQHTPSAERLLRDLGAEGEPELWREGRGLPSTVWVVAGALGRALGPDARYVPRLCVRGASGQWISLQASLSEPTPSRPSETVIVMAPAGPVETSRLNKAIYGLSAREEEICDLVIRGRSTREMSRALHISEYTVQDHLKNVFGKVGVRSRRELLKRLFLDSAMPAK